MKIKKVILGILGGIWQLTGGCVMTIPGLIVTAFVIVFLKGTPHKNGFSYIVEIGDNGGGLEIGAVALCGRYYSKPYFQEVRRHEFGHSMQQLIFGPLQLILVGIPSSIRYWYRKLTPNKKHEDYDAVGFEGTATRWGTRAINRIESGK